MSSEEKLDILKKYDDLSQICRRQTARQLNVSQSLFGRMLKSRQEIGNASLANGSSDRKRKRDGIDDKIEEALENSSSRK